MLAVTTSDLPTSYQQLHTRNAGFSETLLADANLRHLEPHEHAFYEGDAQTHIYRTGRLIALAAGAFKDDDSDS
jgi:hypothetical protein